MEGIWDGAEACDPERTNSARPEVPEGAREVAAAVRQRLFSCGDPRDLRGEGEREEEKGDVDGLLGDLEGAVDAVDGLLERADSPEEMQEDAAAGEVVDEVVERLSEAVALLHRCRDLEPEEVGGVCLAEVAKEARLRRRRRRPSMRV